MGPPPNSSAPAPDGVRVIHLDETDSTNAEVMRRAQAGELGPLWIVARRQSAGRGRLGRRWESPAGNLYCTLLVDLACPPGVAQQLSLVAGVATLEAVRGSAAGYGQLRLKWPNDLLLDAAHPGGILVEGPSFGTRRIAAIGVGVNIASSPSGLGREVTHLAAHGIEMDPERAFAALSRAMQQWIEVWQGGSGFARIREAWTERAGPAGQPISI